MLGLVKEVPARAIRRASAEEFAISMADWKRTGSPGALADLLSFAVDEQLRESLQDVAATTLKFDKASPAMRMIAADILNAGESEAAVWSGASGQENIRSLRSLLRVSPTDTIALVDLAQHHLAHDKRKAAYRCLVAALQLSPNSLHVIRAMARFHVHIGDRSAAHRFIKTAGNVADPWLMASEIAIAQFAGVPSIQLKRAQRAIATDSFSPADVSELAAAVGGAELFNGNLKQARRMFRTALQRPNDNVLAQALHNQEMLGIDIDEPLLSKTENGVFEARAYNAIILADFESAAHHTECWGEEELFSSRPKVLQSYVNGALGRYQEGLEAAESGLRADPADLSLRGNKAYALAGLLRFDDAEAELTLISEKDDGQHSPFSLATRGMIAILRGNSLEGIALYESAIAQFEKRNELESVTSCHAFMARTVSLAGSPERQVIVERAKSRFKAFPSPAASVVLKTIDQDVGPTSPGELRKVIQWEWDPETNVIVEKSHLGRKGAGGFSVKGKER